MTQKANPSINRPAEAFKTAGAIAYGGSDEGFIFPSNETTEISVQDAGINEGNLNAFSQTSGNSLDVTIDGGEAIVFGSWIAIDVQTTVTLAPSDTDQTVFVGWNKNGADDVIVGLESDFASASGDTDKKIPLFDFNTTSSAVGSVTDRRNFDQIRADTIEDGAGSGLDADSVDGQDAADIRSDVSNDGVKVTTASEDLNFSTNIEAADDGDNTSTISLVQGSGSGLDADKVDGLEANELGADVSNDGSLVQANTEDINFDPSILASDDGDNSVTISLAPETSTRLIRTEDLSIHGKTLEAGKTITIGADEGAVVSNDYTVDGTLNIDQGGSISVV